MVEAGSVPCPFKEELPLDASPPVVEVDKAVPFVAVSLIIVEVETLMAYRSYVEVSSLISANHP